MVNAPLAVMSPEVSIRSPSSTVMPDLVPVSLTSPLDVTPAADTAPEKVPVVPDMAPEDDTLPMVSAPLAVMSPEVSTRSPSFTVMPDVPVRFNDPSMSVLPVSSTINLSLLT